MPPSTRIISQTAKLPNGPPRDFSGASFSGRLATCSSLRRTPEEETKLAKSSPGHRFKPGSPFSPGGRKGRGDRGGPSKAGILTPSNHPNEGTDHAERW